jgi:ribosomal protein S18 acetylase RimI-like enzyme
MPSLGPHCVGQRVVVRRVLPGRTGPTGGPAMTDVLGVMESWDGGRTTVRAASGEVVEIAVADIVSGKPVPPRPSTRLRVPAAEAERRAAATWPAPVCEPLGQWLLRAAGGFSRRANSALAAGDPDRPLEEAATRVRRFYADHALPARAQVVVGSDEHLGLERAGWAPRPAGDPDTVFLLASVARASRAARGLAGSGAADVTVSTTATPAWLADDERAVAHGPDALAVLEGPREVAFVSVGQPLVAKGRVALAEGAPDPWAGLTDLWVPTAHRRRGLALRVLVALLGWAAERGATTAFLQCTADNAAALGLYDRLGFAEHHRYRYLTPPDQA